MDKLTNDQYEAITTKLSAKGYTKDTVYDFLKSHKFKVIFEGEVYSIYVARVIAIMRSRTKNNSEETEAADLDN